MDLTYHKRGMRTTPSRFSAYVAAADPLPGGPTVHSEPAADDEASVIEERYPNVARALTLLWGYPEMNQYFEKAWSGQDPALASLEPAAMAELMLLAAVHQRVCPYRPAKKVEEFYGSGRWADTWQPARLRR
jgi:hypothetical protein